MSRKPSKNLPPGGGTETEEGDSFLRGASLHPVQTCWCTRSPEETEAVGAWFAERLQPDTLILVSGALGVGKTTLIRGMCRALGITEPIRSPTFTLVNEYIIRRPLVLAGLPLFHLDLYRIETAEQLSTLGLDELLERGGITVIEWGEALPALGFDYMPRHLWRINIQLHPDESRMIEATLVHTQ